MLLTRRTALATASLGVLAAACGQTGGGAGAPSGPAGKFEVAGDQALGDPNAPVTIIEYASVTCSHCREFHEKVWPQLKANYVETGKVRFVFREFPTPPAPIAVAGFQIARCAGATPEKYFSVIDVLFEQQNNIFSALQTGTARDALMNVARSAGLSQQQFETCVSDQAGMKRIEETVKAGVKQYDVQGTPTIIINGEKATTADVYTYEGISKAIDAKIAAT